jgi:general secretion pathway protein F
LKKIQFKRLKTATTKELALLTRQLATLLAAGLPLEEVLSTVAEQNEKTHLKNLLFAIRNKVREGHGLAHSLREFPNTFSNLFCATVAAGEKTGHLDIILLSLADFTEQQHMMRQKIFHALIYPSIMICVSIGIVGFLLEFVVPKMVSVYTDVKQELPGMTQFLIAFSSGIQHYGLYILLLSGVSGFFFLRRFKTNMLFREKVQAALLRLPIVGNALKTVNTARFAQTLSILTSAGVSILEVIKIASQLVTNIPIQKAILAASERVREGANIHLALKQTQYFPAMSIHLIASGEASGQLGPMLKRAADIQENDTKQLIDTTLTLFEPAIILVMGAVVLFIVLAILLPIFQLDQLN